MKRATLLGIAAAAALCGAAPVFAQANRTFVSGQGSDSNPCSLAAPCRSFAQAIIQTNSGGEIVVLDSAGYGAVTITKAVSIVNQDGVEAGVTITGAGSAITVNAGSDDVVNLRGLTVVGGGVGTSGISFNNGQSLNIDKCVIRGFTAGGISMGTVISANLTVTDTTVSNNFEGVFVASAATGAVTTVTLSRLHATGNGNAGLVVNPIGGSVIATVADSLFNNNGSGIIATASGVGLGAPIATVTVDNSKLLETPTGAPAIVAVSAIGGGSTVNLCRTLLGNGTTNVGIGGGKVQSFGNNLGFNQFGAPITF